MHPAHRSLSLTVALLAVLVLGFAWPSLPAAPAARAADPLPRVAYVYGADTATRDVWKSWLELRGFPYDLVAITDTTYDFSKAGVVVIADDTTWPNDWTFNKISSNAQYIIGLGQGGAGYFQARALTIGTVDTGSEQGAKALNPGDTLWATPNVIPMPANNTPALYSLITPFVGATAIPGSDPDITWIASQVTTPAERTVYPLIAQRTSFQRAGIQCNALWGFRRAPNAMGPKGQDLFENLLLAKPCERRVAYVYTQDVGNATRDSFAAMLAARGLGMDAVTLGAAETFDFSQDLAIIIAHDTFSGSAWGGTPAALAHVNGAGKPILGVGVGGHRFMGALSLAIGSNGVLDTNTGVVVVDASQPVWSAPYPIATATGATVALYSAASQYVGIEEPPSLPAAVTRIGRQVTPKPQTLFPLAAERNQAGRCYGLWGFIAPPTSAASGITLGALGQDLFMNMLLGKPCAPGSGATDPKANLRLSKTDAPDPVYTNADVSYQLTAANAGPNIATNVKIVDTLPAGATFVSATPSQGTCTFASGAITCQIGTLYPGGAIATVKIVVRFSKPGTYTNNAVISSAVADPDLSNNSSSAATLVKTAPVVAPITAIPFFPIFKGPIFTLPQIDLSVAGIELTQGIQCFDTSKGLSGCSDNSLPLVAQKDTTARIYLRCTGADCGSGIPNVPVRLTIIANGVTYTANASGPARTTISQANASDSANVYFNVNFANGIDGVQFRAVVDPNNAIFETNNANNTSGTYIKSFSKRTAMKIVSQRLRYHPSGYSGTQYAGGQAVNGGASQWYNQLLPLKNNAINHSVASGYLDWTTSMSTDGQHSLIQNLNLRWIMQNAFAWIFGTGAFTGARHVYGWVPAGSGLGGHADMPVYPHAGGFGVVAIGNDNPGVNTDNPGSGALIFGHELVHDYDVKHTNTSDSCGSSDSTSLFPYSTSSIQEFGFNPITGKVYDPATTHDVMSYCPAGGSKQGWISPFTWSTMYGKLTATNAALAAAPMATGDGSLIVEATIDNPDIAGGASSFGDLYRSLPDLPETPVPAGPYSIELQGAGGAVLATKTFSVTFTSEYATSGQHPLLARLAAPGDPATRPDATISFVMPWAAGTQMVVLKHGAAILTSRAVSANAPMLEITSPTTPVSWPAGSTQTLTWAANDADPGTTLKYSVFYSRDGVEWEPLATGLAATSFAVDVDSLAGGANARFRVVATDGVNTGDDETSAPISVPDKAPIPIITNPADGTVVAPEELLVLQGIGSDLEDGQLPDGSLSWSSDKQGLLGTGPSLPLNTLQPGFHTITLTVTDSTGQPGTATVQVLIGYRVLLPVARRN